MALRQRVLSGRCHLKGLVRALYRRYHLFAAAAVSRYRVAHQRVIFGQYARLHQRVNKAYKSARVATGVRNSFRLRDVRSVLSRKLWKSVVPCGVGAVRGGSVYHPHVRVLYQRYRLYRRRVGQAEKRYVGRVYYLFSRRIVLALFLVYLQYLYVVALCETLVYLQARSACASVYKYLCFHKAFRTFHLCFFFAELSESSKQPFSISRISCSVAFSTDT